MSSEAIKQAQKYILEKHHTIIVELIVHRIYMYHPGRRIRNYLKNGFKNQPFGEIGLH